MSKIEPGTVEKNSSIIGQPAGIKALPFWCNAQTTNHISLEQRHRKIVEFNRHIYHLI